MRMPFGKHRGQALSDLPDEYLEWLLGIELRNPVFEAVGAEFSRRAGGRRPASSGQAPTLSIAIKTWEVPQMRDLVERGYHSLAKSHHPDAGGATDTMQQINCLADSLKSQLGALEARR